ncbi:MAG TPA: M13-type metalloendopeptidase [Vicinamibacterales bacterium]
MIRVRFVPAAAAALLVTTCLPAPGGAGQHRCLDEACTLVSLFDVPPAQSAGPAADADVPVAPPRFGTWGIDLTGMDRSVKPGDDFFRFVNGAWADRAKIPPDRTSYGAFSILRDISEMQVRRILEDWTAATDLKPGSDEAKVAALYTDFMNEARVEELDAKPLEPKLAAIRQATTREAIVELMGRSHTTAGNSFFAAAVFDDQRHPDRYALYLRQAGIGLPDREFYLRENFAPQKKAYQEYVERMLTLAGWPDAAKHAPAIVALETRLAEAHWTRAESRNRDRTYNPMTLAELEKHAPGFPWKVWFEAAGIAHAERAIVAQNTAFPKLAAAFAETPLETLQAWQAFHTTDQAAPYLSKRFATAHWEFRSKFLQGAQEQRARWKRAVEFAERSMGEAIGREYVRRHFPPESKAKMEKLVADLKVAMRMRIERLDWMAPETKKAALDKLSKFGVKIGYPVKWRDYSALEVVPGDLFGNMERAVAFEWKRDASRIGGPVDEQEWAMTPQTVNAYYTSAKNEIVFPAAILQPPFFDPEADPAVNYGAIGGVIGHEITHGFDDQGRKSDGDGVLRDWWTPEDAARFESQAEKLGAQYEAFEFPSLPGLRINARLTMGENIADLGGVLLGLEAYRVSLQGKTPPVLDGFTGVQRVFLGWTQCWRVLYRDDALRQQIVSNPHSPGFIRAFAPHRNVDEWYDAFDVRPGDRHYLAPEDRARIW